MSTEQIHLEKITWDNYEQLCKLRVKKEQDDYVARNNESLIHAYVAISEGQTRPFPFGIYLGKKPVGFVMIGYNGYEDGDPEFMKNTYFIWRLMIDKRYQGRGYGREAIRQALNFVRTWPCGQAELCEISFEPENEVARALYHACGFVENGEKDGDELVAVLKL